MAGGDRVRLVAGHAGCVRQPQQGPDALDREAEIARMLDEGESLDMGAAIATLIALGALRLRQQADLLVIADGMVSTLTPVRSASVPIGTTRSRVFAGGMIFPLEAVVARGCR